MSGHATWRNRYHWSDRVPSRHALLPPIVWFMVVTNTPPGMALGRLLRQCREEAFPGKDRRGSMRRVAALIGVTHAALSQWESGKRTPSVENVVRLLTIYKISGEKYHRIVDIARHAGQSSWVTSGAMGISQALAGVLE